MGFVGVVAVGVMNDLGSERGEGKRGMRLVALVELVRQRSGHLTGEIVGVVGSSSDGWSLLRGYTAAVVAFDGLAWVRLNVVNEAPGFGSPRKDCPLSVHFEANLAVAEDFVEDVEVLVVEIVGDSDILRTVVLGVGDSPQVLLATVVMGEEQQVPGTAERPKSPASRIPEVEAVAGGVLHFWVEMQVHPAASHRQVVPGRTLVAGHPIDPQ